MPKIIICDHGLKVSTCKACIYRRSKDYKKRVHFGICRLCREQRIVRWTSLGNRNHCGFICIDCERAKVLNSKSKAFSSNPRNSKTFPRARNKYGLQSLYHYDKVV